LRQQDYYFEINYPGVTLQTLNSKSHSKADQALLLDLAAELTRKIRKFKCHVQFYGVEGLPPLASKPEK
jgi:hypothetical protein